jgi:hypothetical protein
MRHDQSVAQVRAISTIPISVMDTSAQNFEVAELQGVFEELSDSRK